MIFNYCFNLEHTKFCHEIIIILVIIKIFFIKYLAIIQTQR